MNLVIESFKTDTTSGDLSEVKYLDGFVVNDGKATANYKNVFCDPHIQITSVTESSGTISQLKVKYDGGAEQTLEPAGG